MDINNLPDVQDGATVKTWVKATAGATGEVEHTVVFDPRADRAITFTCTGTTLNFSCIEADTPEEFPGDNFYHAHCHMTTTLVGKNCTEAKEAAVKLIEDNIDTGSEYKGQMAIKNQGDDPASSWIWSTRLTYNKKYTDDQLFEFTPSGPEGT